MAIHYDISSLDSNKTILETLHRIEKYLKDNPIYKVYAINTPYVAGKQYNLTDLVASDSTLAEGDVVFFTNNYYAFVSAVGSEVFSVANASYFKGETGAQGAQGEQGEAGKDGADTLWYKNNILISTAEQFTALLNEASHSFSTAYFNRTPKVGDNFMVFVYLTYAKETYWLQYQVSAVSGGSTTAVYQNSYAKLTGAKGDTGATGKTALVYGETIPFSRGESSIQLIEQALPFANFNRIPELNEDFIAILHDTLTLKDYIANVEVQTINSGSQVVSACVASNIALITGADGQNGTNGTNGKDALTTIKILTTGVEPAISQTKTLSASYFNRTPDNNEVCPIIIVYNSTRTYQAMIRVLSNTNYTCEIIDVVETTGAQGAGSTVEAQYLHYCYFSFAGGGLHITILTPDSSSYNNGTQFKTAFSTYYSSYNSVMATGYYNSKVIVGFTYKQNSYYLQYADGTQEEMPNITGSNDRVRSTVNIT